VLPTGLVTKASGKVYRPKVASERLGHAVDPAKQHRRSIVQPRAIVKDLVGRGEAQLVTLAIGNNSGISRPEQLRESAQIKLVALQARLNAAFRAAVSPPGG